MPIDFHRSPHVEPVLGPRRIALPAPPARAPRDRFPAIAMAAPLVVGMAMLAVMPSPLTLAFVALSPLLAQSSWIDQRVRSRRDRRSAATAFATELEHARRRLVAGQHEERAFRLAADPAAMEIAERMLRHDPGLWSRRPGEDGFLRLRLGLGRRPSLVTAIQSPASEGLAEDRDRVEALAQAHAELDAVPVVASAGMLPSDGWTFAQSERVGDDLMLTARPCSPA